MNYLVTGGAGFIGSHLVDRLLKKKNNQVTVVDDFSTGLWNNVFPRKRLTVYQSSVLDDIGFLFEGIDVVFHLAALTRPRWSIIHPAETNMTNVGGTLNVLGHCSNKGVGKVVFVSSASVYGDQKEFPLTENMTLNPMSPYALTKQVGEQYCKLFEKLYKLTVNVIRPFNVYGARQSLCGEYSAAVSAFIDNLSKETTPKITGDGKQVRDFVYVDDVVDLMIAVSESGLCGEVLNVGSGVGTSINDLFDIICRTMNKKVKPIYVSPVIDPETQADIGKVKALLAWEPKTSLNEGLKRTIEGTK